MSRNTTRNTAGMIGIALAGLVLGNSAFAMQPLAQGYMLAASHAAGEGKCGEGKCGSTQAKPAKGAASKAAEGKCGEGQCGDARFNKTDANDDGLVSKAEYLKAVPTGEGWADKDANADGFISEREAYDYTKARFEANGKKVPIGRFAAFPE
ncbi:MULTISPECIES: EF-hand domain-containing protein [unclassified Lysobacter]|uniref:HvfA family oxazolone/thioamide-modified RiPP metallophore n=1 Tax=unclassified Lysobacter TaxID=2635362 RepID=UPI001C250FFD|nr:EF-hand domain-containing protein [Lysobacter sp. MMG2]MBU8977846.1 EF-hand domain-containing protein [Lysobacter sp. MMG2]